MIMNFLLKYCVLLSYFIAVIAFGQTTEEDFAQSLQALHQQWGIVNYTLSGEQQEKAFEQLDKQSIAFTENFSHKAEVWAWRGIVQSSFAGAKGGFGALSLVKQAKKSLEKAILIDGNVLSGSAYTSLGILYHKVPSWPISFGDDDEAKNYLRKALTLDPNGIDSNYFYGELLYDKRQYAKAKEYLFIAKNSPVKYSADEFRKADIDLLISKVDKKLAKNKH
jgi:tetratricopeptide (TPR) repeat protein